MLTKLEKNANKRIRLEPPFHSGDCGYYALFTGILYLALAARDNEKLEKLLNQSQPLTEILDVMKCNTFRREPAGRKNTEVLQKMLDSMQLNDWDKLSYHELLMDFSNAMRYVLQHFPWGKDYFKSVIKEGAWSFDNHSWNSLPSFKSLEQNVLSRMSEMVGNRNVGIEEAGEVRFKATLEVCRELQDKELSSMAEDVIKYHYGTASQKIWVGREFLEFICQALFSSATLLFDESGVEINSKGTSNSHWYIDLPDDTFTASLYQMANTGYLKDLRIIERFTLVDKNKETLENKESALSKLIEIRRNNLAEFKILISSVPVANEGISALAFFDTQLPAESTITEAMLPLVSVDDKWMSSYTKMVLLSKSVEKDQIKIDTLKEEIRVIKSAAKSNISTIHFFGTTIPVSEEGAKISTCSENRLGT